MKKVSENMINVNITDAGNTQNYALKKIYEWGYEVFISNTDEKDKIYFDNFMWSAQKDGKIYTEKDPLRLLGLITLFSEYLPEKATEDFTEEEFDIFAESYLLKPFKTEQNK